MKKPDSQSHQKESGKQSHNAPFQGLRILIVEDMGLIAEDLRLSMIDLGCQVVGSAARLAEAEVLAREESIDGVLLDLNLAGKSTYSVAEILRRRGIPFIFLSGYESSRLREDFAGEPHLQKPFGRDDLAAVMRTAFGHRHTQSSE